MKPALKTVNSTVFELKKRSRATGVRGRALIAFSQNDRESRHNICIILGHEFFIAWGIYLILTPTMNIPNNIQAMSIGPITHLTTGPHNE